MIPRAFLAEMFSEVVSACLPDRVMGSTLPDRLKVKGKTLVLGAGKASASMAAALEAEWDGPLEGLVITRYGHSWPTRSIEVVEAGHPIPDKAGMMATNRIMSLARSAKKDDLVISLISGGASSLLVAPAEGITLQDKQDINRRLLEVGAPIEEINLVRRQLSAIKAGKLGQLIEPASSHTFIISDVPDNNVYAVGSGPTIFNTNENQNDALEIVAKYNLDLSPSIKKVLKNQAFPMSSGTKNSISVLASSTEAIAAAKGFAIDRGVTPVVISENLIGEAKEVALDVANVINNILTGELLVNRPCVVLSGGETSVTLPRNSGPGGRNTEFLLALTLALSDVPDYTAIACDTDGIDGYGENAGAITDGQSLRRARLNGLNPENMLAEHQGYLFFKGLDDLLITGPTLTNVNDFRAVYLE